MKKILIIQLRKLGDVITTTPAVRQLRKKYPDAQIDFLTENLGANVYRYSNHIDNLISIKRKQSFIEYVRLIYKIRREKYDILLDLFCNPKSAQITFLSGVKLRYGFKKGIRDFVYTNLVDLYFKLNNKFPYVCFHKFMMLDEFMEVNFDDIYLEVNITDKEREFAFDFCNKKGINRHKTIALCVVSERLKARCSYEFYIFLSNFLIGKGFNIYFLYGPNEKDQVMNVYREINNKSECIVDYKQTTILENRAILENCKMYLGNDGGTKHLAVASNIPTYTVFSTDRFENWTPPNDKKHKGIMYKDYDKYENIVEDIYNFIKKIDIK